jgi:hypothetical protein
MREEHKLAFTKEPVVSLESGDRKEHTLAARRAATIAALHNEGELSARSTLQTSACDHRSRGGHCATSCECH